MKTNISEKRHLNSLKLLKKNCSCWPKDGSGVLHFANRFSHMDFDLISKSIDKEKK
jgi:hypothetical protein